MKILLIIFLFSSVLFAAEKKEEQAVATITEVQGKAFIRRWDSIRRSQIIPNMKVYENDRILTEQSGEVKIKFAERTYYIKPATFIKIAKTYEGSAVMKLKSNKGALKHKGYKESSKDYLYIKNPERKEGVPKKQFLKIIKDTKGKPSKD